MNYTRITINGKDVGLRFGMMALKEMEGVDISDTVKSTAKLLFGSHKNWCEVKEEQPCISYGECYDFVETSFMSQDQSASEELADIWTKFNDSLAPLVEGDKKKQTGKRSKKSPSVS